jgi:hypothetical protein
MEIIEAQIVKKTFRTHIFNFIKREPVGTLFIAILIFFFGGVTVANAYTMGVRWYMEKSLADSAHAAQEAQVNAEKEMAACEDSYQAIKQFKIDYKIALDGNPDPCSVTF